MIFAPAGGCTFAGVPTSLILSFSISTAAGEITLPVRGSSRWAASTRVTVAGDCASRWPPGLSRASSRRISFFIERLPSSSPVEKMIYYIFRLFYYVHRSNATSGPPDCAALEVCDQQDGCLSGVLRVEAGSSITPED